MRAEGEKDPILAGDGTATGVHDVDVDGVMRHPPTYQPNTIQDLTNMILIIDFGSQFNQLIARRVRGK